MDFLLHVGLSNALVAVLLTGVAAAATLSRRRPALVHGLWLLVLLKLVTPPLVWVPVPWPVKAPVAATAVAGAPDVVFSILLDGNEIVIGEPVIVPASTTEIEPATPAVTIDALAKPTTWPWAHMFAGVWLLGSVAWFLLAGWRVARFHWLLRHARRVPAALQRRADELAREMGMRAAPSVVDVPGRLAPLVWALGRPRIVLPASLLDQVAPEQLDALLTHELAHLRRRDHYVRALEFLVLGLYWWLPVAWYACRQLHKAEEQCCDAWVVSTLPGSGRAYATALVETLDFLSDAPAPPLLASGLGQVSDLKRRLRMILMGKTPRALTWRGCVALLGVGVLLLPALPALVSGEEEKRPPERRAEPPKPEDAEKVKALRAELDKRAGELAEIAKKLHEVMHRGGPEGRPMPPGGAEPRPFMLFKRGDQWVVMPAPPHFEGGRPGERRPPPREGREAPPDGRDPGRRPPPEGGPEGRRPPPDADREGRGGDRVERLERQLEAVLRELEMMRRDLNRGGPPRRGPEGGPPPRRGPEGDRRPEKPGVQPPPPRDKE